MRERHIGIRLMVVIAGFIMNLCVVAVECVFVSNFRLVHVLLGKWLAQG